MKRMLINATQEEELRMAMVDGQRLYDLNIELPASERKKANIYKGQITRIEPSLEAAFVNYGADRHGFLPLKEISSEYFVAEPSQGGKPNIKEVLREGQDIVVQIDKEERGNKGAALTTYVSLAGRFIVLKPNKARSGGVSRRIVGEDRDLARKSLRDVEVPDGMSVILRTAGIERSAEELTWDMENLLSVWEAIKKVVVERDTPFLIYRESNAVVRALRDYLTNEIGEILIDDEATYKEAQEFVEQVMPHNMRKLKHYTDSVPLFTRYQIDSQIESAFAHSVTLPSGGSLVIDHTEALVSIDINSARATKGGDIEATALNTNLEAADEVARQLRLRDLGGLVVIDFIDMGPQRNQRDVENRLREAVRQDRARVQLSKISRFGLLEMSRQRLRPSLGESSYLVCPRCSGIGNIRSVESLALAILRLVGEEARKERTAKVIAQLPIEVATYLLNEKRDWVQSLESRHDTQVILVANPALETPHYQVRRVRDDQVDLPENVGNSFSLAETPDEPEITQAMEDKKPAEIAAITTVVQTTPAPLRPEPPKKSTPGFLSKIASLFSASDDDEESKPKRASRSKKSQSDSRRRAPQRKKKRSDSSRQNAKKTQSRQGKSSAKKRSKKNGTRAKDTERKANPPTKSAQVDGEAKQGDNRQSTNKRRSRGGRRRRRGNQESTEQLDSAAKTSSDSVDAKDSSKSDKQPNASSESRRPAPDNKADARKPTDAPAEPVTQTTEKPADGKSTADPTAKVEKAPRKPRRSRKPAAEKTDASLKQEKPAQEDASAESSRTATDSNGHKRDAEQKTKAPDDAQLTQVKTRKTTETKRPRSSKPKAGEPKTDVAHAESSAKSAADTATTKTESKSSAAATRRSGEAEIQQALPAKPAKSASHEDTLPELPTLKSTEPAPRKKAAAKQDAPKSNGDGQAAKPDNKSPQVGEKGATRLLPWDSDNSGKPGTSD